jgi:hypothetical protein
MSDRCSSNENSFVPTRMMPWARSSCKARTRGIAATSARRQTAWSGHKLPNWRRSVRSTGKGPRFQNCRGEPAAWSNALHTYCFTAALKYNSSSGYVAAVAWACMTTIMHQLRSNADTRARMGVPRTTQHSSFHAAAPAQGAPGLRCGRPDCWPRTRRRSVPEAPHARSGGGGQTGGARVKQTWHAACEQRPMVACLLLEPTRLRSGLGEEHTQRKEEGPRYLRYE